MSKTTAAGREDLPSTEPAPRPDEHPPRAVSGTWRPPAAPAVVRVCDLTAGDVCVLLATTRAAPAPPDLGRGATTAIVRVAPDGAVHLRYASADGRQRTQVVAPTTLGACAPRARVFVEPPWVGEAPRLRVWDLVEVLT